MNDQEKASTLLAILLLEDVATRTLVFEPVAAGVPRPEVFRDLLRDLEHKLEKRCWL